MSSVNQFIPPAKAGTVDLPGLGGLTPSAHVIDKESILAINAALATRRPLLVRGEPGTGKSQLARAAAALLDRTFLSHAVDARTETRDLLWTADAVARLATAQVMSALRTVDHDEVKRRIDVLEFIHPGPIWWAFDWHDARKQAQRVRASEPVTPEDWNPNQGAVVLIDEIDKADSSVPNGLLDALAHGRFAVHGRSPVAMNAERLPLIIMTTNEERSMPDAFLRRCFVLHLALPTRDAELIEIVVGRCRAHFPQCSEAVLHRAAELLALDRKEYKMRDLSPPGLAECVDLVRAVTEQRPGNDEEQLSLLEQVSKFAYGKHPREQMQ